MLGLIKKDLLMIKGNLKSIIIIIFILVIVSASENGNLAFLPAFISMTLFLSTFSYDEYNKWDAYAITVPGGREKVVISKYIATLILLLISLFISTILSFIMGYFSHHIDILEILSIMTGSSIAVILIEAFMYPIIFKFGIEKGRIAFFAITFIVIGMITLLSRNIKLSENFVHFMTQYGIIISIIVSFILLGLSYYLSKKIYEKKEF